MKKQIIFHDDYLTVYSYDPAAEEGRLESILNHLEDFEMITPEPAKETDILLNHTEHHLESVQKDFEVYPIALLAAGGAILASEYAVQGNPMFALIRPPGHHASPEGYWGFCYFNNIAIAIKRLLYEEEIKKAAIIDIDLHFGDGTDAAFTNDDRVTFFEVKGSTPEEFIDNLQNFLNKLVKEKTDIIGVSAGFDRGTGDWGDLLSSEDYKKIGSMIASCAERISAGRFAVLEGGYNFNVLGKNVRAFIDGFY